jgi:hypothetical protein
MKSRCFPEHNYKAFFIDGKTLRIKLDPSKPITNLKYPEFMDVKITNRCQGGCPYCYQNSGQENDGYSNALEKLDIYFGGLSENQKPFQVAIGGGNPNEHPYFIEILRTFTRNGIVPNYTTNGMNLSSDIAGETVRHCGGIAISCHPHLKNHWERAVGIFYKHIQTNLHVIISDAASVERFEHIYSKYMDKVKYFVLLPYEAAGRAPKAEVNYDELTNLLEAIGSTEKIAFGANFYKYLCGSDFKISLYEPEIFSKFLDVKDMTFYNSSFNLTKPEVL